MNKNAPSSGNFESLVLTAELHVKSLLTEVFEHTDKESAVLVYDTGCLLSTVLSEAYKRCLPDATFIDFNQVTPENILAILGELQPSDLVVLVQSTSFRLDAFRMRIELFKRKIKVLEHPHLSRMSDDEAVCYIDALAYDASYYRGVGRTLKSKIDSAPFGTVESGGELLVYGSPFEPAKLNIGDYSEMVNTGGQFPIGEVFTEAQELTALNGRVNIFCFGDVDYKINRPEMPITLIIEQGQVVECENSTPSFDAIISKIRADEGVVWVRELGFGLNRALTKNRTLADTGSYERMCGVHVSLGAKHGIYGKPGFKRRDGIYHVDVFVDTNYVTLGDDVVYSNGAWIV
ncbi:MAG: hypothetical protein PF439_10635 [Helicobacteraceae bacterium]|jgi:aminopeptidase|nr:hypothetical protein [Helicobacteraceae bacterium]